MTRFGQAGDSDERLREFDALRGGIGQLRTRWTRYSRKSVGACVLSSALLVPAFVQRVALRIAGLVGSGRRAISKAPVL